MVAPVGPIVRPYCPGANCAILRIEPLSRRLCGLVVFLRGRWGLTMASPAAKAPFFLVRTELVLSRSRQSGGGAGEECTCTKASTATEHRNPPVKAMPLMCLDCFLLLLRRKAEAFVVSHR